jgi:hypothetical protein
MRDGFDDQRVPRIEMCLKPTVRQAGLFHEIGDADAVSAFFPKLDRSPLYYLGVRLKLVLFGIPHGALMICLKSYNDAGSFIIDRGELLQLICLSFAT